MSELATTAGPWRVWNERRDLWEVFQSPGPRIAIVCGDNRQGDATLMAAAPDLLLELRRARYAAIRGLPVSIASIDAAITNATTTWSK